MRSFWWNALLSIFVSLLVVLTLGPLLVVGNSSATKDEEGKSGASSAESAKLKDDEDTKRAKKDLEKYQKLFMEKRGQHYQAVRSLMESYDYEKTYQMIDLLLDRMRTVVGESRQVLKDKGFEAGMPFPRDEEVKEGISIILENAALFGDMALSLPDITHKILKKKKAEARDTLKWSISFGRNTGFYDDIHSQLLHLAAQELEMVKKEPDYFNPYKQENQTPPPSKEKKKREKKEVKRGPRASKSEL